MYRHVQKVDKEFKMITGSLEECHTYVFGRKELKHLSCPECATALFAFSEKHNLVAVNVRCIDGIDLESLVLQKIDGKNLL